MSLDDILYFQINRQRLPAVYELATRVAELSGQTANDAADFERRLTLLAGVPEPNGEQRRKAVDFLCELIAYDQLHHQGFTPNWVPETRLPMPDISYPAQELAEPVEVKHLNPPRAEDVALSTGQMYGGSVNQTYELGLQQKIRDFIMSARTKFTHFNQQINERQSSNGTLYLFYSRSIDASLVDGIPWSTPMADRVTQIAEPLAGSDVKLVIHDVENCFS